MTFKFINLKIKFMTLCKTKLYVFSSMNLLSSSILDLRNMLFQDTMLTEQSKHSKTL